MSTSESQADESGTGARSTVAASAGGAEPAVAAPVAQAVDLSELDTLGTRPLAEHAEVFGRIHEQLQAALAQLDAD